MDEKEPKIGRKRIMKIVGKALIAIGAIYVCIWLWFLFDGGFPTGGLGKEGWLGFLGDFLGFVGTVALGTVAVYQTDRANKATEKANEELKISNRKVEELTAQANKLSELQLKHAAYSRIELDRFYLCEGKLWFVFDEVDKTATKIEFEEFRLYKQDSHGDVYMNFTNIVVNRIFEVYTKFFAGYPKRGYKKEKADTTKLVANFEVGYENIEMCNNVLTCNNICLKYTLKIYNALNIVTTISTDTRLDSEQFYSDNNNSLLLAEPHTHIEDIARIK